ncbi:MAG: helix-turn-helix transcriptional regulator [Chloroflexota bacterium]|nr:helix-turn-helix transcriptional regulator [Chloroflexota bacterium]
MATRATPPEIVVRGDEVYDAARRCMQPPLTVIAAFQGPQVSQHTLEAYRDGTATRLQFDVLGRLCWFFGCMIDDLLAVRPRGSTQELRPIEIVRTMVPSRLPPVGAIRVINYIQAEVAMSYAHIIQVTDWKQPNVFAMTRGGYRQVLRPTLETLLGVLGYDRVSQLLNIQIDFDAMDPEAPLAGGSLAERIEVVEPRPGWLTADWEQIVAEWRRLQGGPPRPGTLSSTDVAVLRYLDAEIRRQADGRPVALPVKLAQALGVTRTLMQEVVHGIVQPQVGSHDLSPAVRELVAPLVSPTWRQSV